MFFVSVLSVAAPDRPAVLIGAVPDLGAVKFSALSAADLRREDGGAAEAPASAALVDQILHPVEGRRLDNGGMAVFHKVLRHGPVVLHALPVRIT